MTNRTGMISDFSLPIRPLPLAWKTPAWAGALADSGGNAPDGDVIVSARARLARNIADFPFPSKATETDLRRIAQAVRQAAHADVGRLYDLHPVAVDTLSERDKAELVDARRISPELAEGGPERYALLDQVGSISLFVNEEDHIRIQTLAPGNATRAALLSAEDAEARLSTRLRWAVEPERWGFLTASPSNVGTGLRISVLAHLPALAFLNRLDDTLAAARRLGISIRGAHGENSVAAGDLYQVSNAMTFGLSTDHLEGRVRPVADYLVRTERTARRDLVNDRKKRDRAITAAKNAWERIETAPQLSARESLDRLSTLRLCAAAGLTPFGRWVQTAPAPDDRLFVRLVAELRTGGGLTTGEGAAALRDAISRPALLRSMLSEFYGGKSG